MTTATYPPPLDKLLTYGDCRNFRKWPNYVEELGFAPEHIPDLLRMATDDELNWADLNNLEVWAPIHAWRILGQLRAEAAIEPLISLFHELEDIDWTSTEMPEVFALIGSTAIPALTAYLADSSHEIYPRTTAADCLTEIGKMHPDVRAECVTALTQQLELFAENDSEFNAFLIADLVDLKAVESAPTMERAFAADRVVPFIVGDWSEVQVLLGLKTREEVPQRKFTMEEVVDYFASKSDLEAPRGFSPSLRKSNKKKKHK